MRDEVKFEATISALKNHMKQVGAFDIRSIMAADSRRFERFSCQLDDFLFDFSKTALTNETLMLLDELATASGLAWKRDALFAGDMVNETEQRAALHMALRAPEGQGMTLQGTNITSQVQETLTRMEEFCDAIRSGQMRGATGKIFTDIVNIGIGGSDLGARMVVRALKPYHDGPRCHFVANIDSADIADVLNDLDPQTSLMIVASKTFTTLETMTNARVARQWLVEKLGDDAVQAHFVALSSALGHVADFGIAKTHRFGFWNWVGGRYSIWSAIGLSVMLAIGGKQFRRFLDGAHVMDCHFRDTPFHANIPVMLGLIGFFHRVICGYPTRGIIPYEERLCHFPAYLQQLDMESNGKQMRLDGTLSQHPTGPIVWGASGTNAQHAFFQLLHQGSDIVPIEFITFLKGHEKHLERQHDMLLANCLAQAEALMLGKSQEEAYHTLLAQGLGTFEADKLSRHQTFPGNRPSMIFMQDLLTPFSLGRLLALYEHRVFVEGVLMNINSFDQWGVELGKQLASELLPMVSGEREATERDVSTLGLLAHIRAQTRSNN